jgi:hypothetical protein
VIRTEPNPGVVCVRTITPRTVLELIKRAIAFCGSSFRGGGPLPGPLENPLNGGPLNGGPLGNCCCWVCPSVNPRVTTAKSKFAKKRRAIGSEFEFRVKFRAALHTLGGDRK